MATKYCEKHLVGKNLVEYLQKVVANRATSTNVRTALNTLAVPSICGKIKPKPSKGQFPGCSSAEAHAGPAFETTKTTLTAIDYIRWVMQEYTKARITTDDFIECLLLLINENKLKLPTNACFVVNENQRYTVNFELFEKLSVTKESCVYCTWLGLPESFYSSHRFKNEEEQYICPLYQFYYSYIADFDQLVDAITQMANYMNITKYCKYCKESGKSAEIYRSHVQQLSNKDIICPFLRTSAAAARISRSLCSTYKFKN